MSDVAEIVRGDLKPDLEVTIGDEAGAANFSGVTPAQVSILAEQGGVIVINDVVDQVTPSTDGKTMIVRRAWASGETAVPGHMWLTVVVAWTGSAPQTFPASGPLRLDIRRAAGDA